MDNVITDPNVSHAHRLASTSTSVYEALTGRCGNGYKGTTDEGAAGVLGGVANI